MNRIFNMRNYFCHMLWYANEVFHYKWYVLIIVYHCHCLSTCLMSFTNLITSKTDIQKDVMWCNMNENISLLHSYYSQKTCKWYTECFVYHKGHFLFHCLYYLVLFFYMAFLFLFAMVSIKSHYGYFRNEVLKIQ